MFNPSAQGLRSWVTKVEKNQLASQISSVLLQRHNWSQVLLDLDLSSKLTPPLFLQILRDIQPNHHISLQFFNWTKANLTFQPDLHSHSHLIVASLASGLPGSAESIFDTLVPNHPSSALVDSVIEACDGPTSQPLCLSFILEAYGKKGLLRDGLQVFDKMRARGFSPSTSACNELLNCMRRYDNVRLAWCFIGAMLRNEVLPNHFTWSLIARILGQSGKPLRVGLILEMGIYTSVIYRILIGGLSENGSFEAVFDRLNEMSDKNLQPGFATFSSILDGACRHKNPKVIDKTVSAMIEKGLISKTPLDGCDILIERLCILGRSFAAESFFMKAFNAEMLLKDATYVHMLRAFSTEGRHERAIWIYHLICKKGVALDDYTCKVFSGVVVMKKQCDEVSNLLLDMVKRGFSPPMSHLSGFLVLLCRRRKWKEAEEMANVILDKGLLPDSNSCCLLVDHLCYSGNIDSAMALHNKMEKLDISLDVSTYNVLLNKLVQATRVDEAVQVFDHMRKHNRLTSQGFVVMIWGLAGRNDFKMAMKLHDEMLKEGFKPDLETYKRLILLFK